MNATFTEMYGRIILCVLAMAIILAVAQIAFAAPARVVSPADAIERAVAQRIGGEAAIAVSGLETNVKAQAGLEALPEPGARAGQPVRFVMMAGRTRVGIAVATVLVSGPFPRASRAIARDEAVTPADIAMVHEEWPSVPLTRLPTEDELVGLKARRHIAAGEPLTGTVVDVPPLIRSGDVVTMTATVGAVQVTAAGTATSSGDRGDIIRVTPRPNGRAVRARIIGQAMVEVVR
jgi:flagella basal body P-ring formation protein FlgA